MNWADFLGADSDAISCGQTDILICICDCKRLRVHCLIVKHITLNPEKLKKTSPIKLEQKRNPTFYRFILILFECFFK